MWWDVCISLIFYLWLGFSISFILIFFLRSVFCKCMCSCLHIFCIPLLSFLCHRLKSTVTFSAYDLYDYHFLDQMFLDLTVFYLTLESARKIHGKCGSPPLAKIQIIIQIYLTVSYMKHIFIYFTHLRHCYYDKLFQITLF